MPCSVTFRDVPCAWRVWWQALHKMKTLEVELKMQMQVCNTTQSHVSQVSQVNYTETLCMCRELTDRPPLEKQVVRDRGQVMVRLHAVGSSLFNSGSR